MGAFYPQFCNRHKETLPLAFTFKNALQRCCYINQGCTTLFRLAGTSKLHYYHCTNYCVPCRIYFLFTFHDTLSVALFQSLSSKYSLVRCLVKHMYACMCVLYDKIYHLLAFCRGFASLAWVFGSLGFLVIFPSIIWLYIPFSVLLGLFYH